MNYQKQVAREHYADDSYDSAYRFVSYYNQKQVIIDATKNNKSKTILEIGKGNGLVTNYLKNRGYSVKTFDIAEDLHPDYIGDITQINNVVKEKFDVVACFEILEHIRYEDLPSTLEQLYTVTHESLLISIPQSRLYISFWLKLTKINPLSKYLSLPFPIKHIFNGEHYWELGKKGYSLSRFRNTLREKFQIDDEFTHPLDTYHRFFILTKK